MTVEKVKVGIFGLTSCYGCQLEIINLEERLLTLLDYVDVKYWRLALEIPSDPYDLDIAFVEGSASNNEEVEELKEIRKHANLVITIGACAHLGGVQGMRSLVEEEKVKSAAYSDLSGVRSIPVKAVDEIIKVDFKIRGCPINPSEFLSTVLSLIAGRQPEVWNMPVCVECKIRGNECFFERDKEERYYQTNICLGPISEAGCGARCPSNGMPCDGCRGWTTDPHISQIIKESQQRKKSINDIVMLARRYSGGTTTQNEKIKKGINV
jgi:sulfhydrogenase subunit delta